MSKYGHLRGALVGQSASAAGRAEMPDKMEEIIFVVQELAGGWIVVDGMTNGPFSSNIRAVALAEGMALAVRATGQRARVVVV